MKLRSKLASKLFKLAAWVAPNRIKMAYNPKDNTILGKSVAPILTTKKRGRPKGSKNRPKTS